MFEACLSLPRNPREAQLIAATLEALARALREWPTDAWRAVASQGPGTTSTPPGGDSGLFERLVARVAPLVLTVDQRNAAVESAEAAAAVLRCLWPEAQAASRVGDRPDANPALAPA